VITAIPATGLRWLLPPDHTIIRGLAILTTYGLMYLAAGLQFGLLTMEDVRGILRRRSRGDRPSAGNA
jgi:hypothetical protein